jgi:hypothetical protein
MMLVLSVDEIDGKEITAASIKGIVGAKMLFV